MPALSEKILVRGLNRLGDAVMSTPALQQLRRACPDARISLLSPEKLAGLWEGQPFLDEVLALAPSESVLAAGRRLCQQQFQKAVVFPNSVRSAIEVWLGRIPWRVGIARPGRGFFLNHALPPRPGAVPMRKRSDREARQRIARGVAPDRFPAAAHQVRDYLYLTKELGAASEPLPPRIVVSDRQIEQARRKFGIPAVPDGPLWFGLNPGAEYGPAKRWPAHRFAAAAVLLQQQTPGKWLIFGGADDAPLGELVAAEMRQAGVAAKAILNLVGKTTLPDLAAALKLCRLALTNDTGPMHLAAAVGTPVIVPFGSTSPELTGPTGAQAEIVRKPPPCAPCFRRECPVDLRCFNDITVEEVVAAARRILSA